jgi:hypothetical protein
LTRADGGPPLGLPVTHSDEALEDIESILVEIKG